MKIVELEGVYRACVPDTVAAGPSPECLTPDFSLYKVVKARVHKAIISQVSCYFPPKPLKLIKALQKIVLTFLKMPVNVWKHIYEIV